MGRLYKAVEKAQQNDDKAPMPNEDKHSHVACSCTYPITTPSFDEYFEVSAFNKSDRETRRSQVRSQLSIPDYDSFDEDFKLAWLDIVYGYGFLLDKGFTNGRGRCQ